jgi:hypothetical protein
MDKKTILFNEFCAKKECPEYISWSFGNGTCESCKLIGQSYNITEYPKNRMLFMTVLVNDLIVEETSLNLF